MEKIKAYPTEAAAWEQLKLWKRKADMEKRAGVIQALTVISLNRAYIVLKTIQINQNKAA
jgi:hypothetical protein